MSLAFIAGLLICVSMSSILFRLLRMQPHKTQPVVIAQHLLAFFGLAGALVLPEAFALPSIAAAFAIYLLAGGHRWRFAAPSDTRTKPADFDDNPASNNLFH